MFEEFHHPISIPWIPMGTLLDLEHVGRDSLNGCGQIRTSGGLQRIQHGLRHGNAEPNNDDEFHGGPKKTAGREDETMVNQW